MARRRTRRVDGVEVDRSLPRDAVRALRTATTPIAPVRGRLRTARGPRGCPRRPGARRWRRRVASLPLRRSEPRRPPRASYSAFRPTRPEPAPTRSERLQNRKRDHPRPPLLETKRVDGVKPPQHRGAPRYRPGCLVVLRRARRAEPAADSDGDDAPTASPGARAAAASRTAALSRTLGGAFMLVAIERGWGTIQNVPPGRRIDDPELTTSKRKVAVGSGEEEVAASSAR